MVTICVLKNVIHLYHTALFDFLFDNILCSMLLILNSIAVFTIQEI